jgi:hypothetical protein
LVVEGRCQWRAVATAIRQCRRCGPCGREKVRQEMESWRGREREGGRERVRGRDEGDLERNGE